MVLCLVDLIKNGNSNMRMNGGNDLFLMDKKAVIASVSLLMAISLPSMAWGAAEIDNGSRINVRTLSDLSTTAGSEFNGSQAAWGASEHALALSDGRLLVSDAVHHVIWSIKGQERSVLAGSDIPLAYDKGGHALGAYLDVAALQSFFNQPKGLAEDAVGNVYIADSGNHAIRKLDSKGQVSTLAGNGVQGNTDGQGSLAKFNYPQDVAVTPAGIVYVADTLNHKIRQITPEGKVTTLNAASSRLVEVFPGVVQHAGDYRDGEIAQALFNEPSGLALDEHGNLYISDTGNQVIRYIDFAKHTVSTVAGGLEAAKLSAIYVTGGYVNGKSGSAKFNFPKGLVWSAKQQQLYIADSKNNAIRVLKKGQVTTLIGSQIGKVGQTDGTENRALLTHPQDIELAPNGQGGWITGSSIRESSDYAIPASRPKNTVAIAYGNKWLDLRPGAEIQGGRIMVPLQATAEALGYHVKSAIQIFSSAAVVATGSSKVKIATRENVTLSKEGKEFTLVFNNPSDAFYISNNQLFLPIRELAEQLGMDVEWIQDQKVMIIRD